MNKNDIISKVYHDPAGYGSNAATLEDAKKYDASMTLQDVKDYADVLKIEYPTDVKNAELSAGKNYLMQITKLLNDKPWVLLSRGDMNFEKYYEAVKISLECGGKGYAVGRAIWQEIADLKNFNEVVNFINTTGLARIKKLNTLFPDD